MRRVKEVIDEYDKSDKTDKKKILLIEWLQKHPGRRFDKSEIYQELKDELGVGQGRTGQILKDLEKENVIDTHGDQRKAYRLADDILIPVKYQTLAGLRHLWTIIDIKRWGVIGFLVISVILWVFLTFPFWFFSVLLVLLPVDKIGPISQSEIIVLTLLMTIWLLTLTTLTSVLQMIRRWWNERSRGK